MSLIIRGLLLICNFQSCHVQCLIYYFWGGRREYLAFASSHFPPEVFVLIYVFVLLFFLQKCDRQFLTRSLIFLWTSVSPLLQFTHCAGGLKSGLWAHWTSSIQVGSSGGRSQPLLKYNEFFVGGFWGCSKQYDQNRRQCGSAWRESINHRWRTVW